MSGSNLLLDLHTDFSGGRTGGLVFPSLSEFSTVCCDPHSQRLWQLDIRNINNPIKKLAKDINRQLPGASVRNPARDKVMRKEADIRKACSDFRDQIGRAHV